MNSMMRVIGLVIAFIGGLMLVMASNVDDMIIFQAELVIGFPMVFFGIKLLMS